MGDKPRSNTDGQMTSVSVTIGKPSFEEAYWTVIRHLESIRRTPQEEELLTALRRVQYMVIPH